MADLAGAMSLNVENVWVKTGDTETLISINNVREGDLIVVRTGNMIPLDGKVAGGEATVNQASITGESLPVRKSEGSYVYAGTVVEEGECVVCVDKALGGGRYDRIVKMIEQSEKLKSSSEDKASRLADRLVPYTLGGTILTYLLTRNVTKMLAVLMVDFSCALKLSMPIAVLSAMRECSNYKISVKGGKFLEAVSEADTIVFDKTGTLTYAAPTVEKVIPYVDTVLLDIKHLDTEKHKKFTGIGNEQILKNAARISQISSTVVRVPVIPGFNYSEEEIRAITEFAKTLRGMRTIHLLPYHTFGENKYDLLGRDYALADIKPLKPEELEHLKTMVEREGFQCIIGG